MAALCLDSTAFTHSKVNAMQLLKVDSAIAISMCEWSGALHSVTK